MYCACAQQDCHVPDFRPPAPSSKPDILYTPSHPATCARRSAPQTSISLLPDEHARLLYPQDNAALAFCNLLCYPAGLHSWTFRPAMHRMRTAYKMLGDHCEAGSRFRALWSSRGMAGYAEGSQMQAIAPAELHEAGDVAVLLLSCWGGRHFDHCAIRNIRHFTSTIALVGKLAVASTLLDCNGISCR